MTPAIKLLERRGIFHEVHSYEPDPAAPSYGEEAAQALGLPMAEVFKTLVAKVDGAELVVAVIPVEHHLNLKALARAAGAKKAAMADVAEAERSTGYVAGGISPLGQRKQLRTFIDDKALALALINVSGGRRGLELRLAPVDLASAADARFASLIG